MFTSHNYQHITQKVRGEKGKKSTLTMQYRRQPLLYCPFDRLSCNSSTTNLHIFISAARPTSLYLFAISHKHISAQNWKGKNRKYCITRIKMSIKTIPAWGNTYYWFWYQVLGLAQLTPCEPSIDTWKCDLLVCTQISSFLRQKSLACCFHRETIRLPSLPQTHNQSRTSHPMGHAEGQSFAPLTPPSVGWILDKG